MKVTCTKATENSCEQQSNKISNKQRQQKCKYSETQLGQLKLQEEKSVSPPNRTILPPTNKTEPLVESVTTVVDDNQVSKVQNTAKIKTNDRENSEKVTIGEGLTLT